MPILYNTITNTTFTARVVTILSLMKGKSGKVSTGQKAETEFKHITSKKQTHTLIDVVGWEEALLAVSQLTHPPIIIVFEQHCDVVASLQRQLVGPLGLVVIQCNHLQRHSTDHSSERCQCLYVHTDN